MHDHQLPESLQQQFRAFFDQITEDYQRAEQQQDLLERSLEITSQELTVRNQQLKQHIDELEQAKEDIVRKASKKIDVDSGSELADYDGLTGKVDDMAEKEAEEIVNSQLKEGDSIYMELNEEKTELTIKISKGKGKDKVE